MEDMCEEVADCSSTTSFNRKRKHTDDDIAAEELTGYKDGVVLNIYQIKVKLPNGKIISVEAKDSDTIGSIKVKIKDKENIPFDQQELVFNKEALENNDTIANLSLKKDSVLTLMSKSSGFIQIFIQTPDGEITNSVYVKPNETISNVKAKVFYCTRGEVLSFNETVLEDNGTLADFNIVNGSILTNIEKSFGHMDIFLKLYTGETVSMSVNPNYTINELKSHIWCEQDIACDEQVLIFNNVVLGGDGTIFDFHIRKDSTVTLMHKPKGFSRSMYIFIKTLAGKTITEDVKPSDTIGDIKSKIEDEVDVPCGEQELIFDDMVLCDINTVADYHINKGSTLKLMRIESGFMKIFVKTDRKTITLDVRPSDTVRDVISKICSKIRFHPLKRSLIFNGKCMEDGASLADYDVVNKSKVRFVEGDRLE